VAAVGSPTVRRRRLAAELRRLRGNNRTGGEIARALGWSPAKISRYELGQGGFPLDEVGKLLDFYGVTEPRRTHLLDLAADANARGWWEDYADVLEPAFIEFIGLEAEAFSMMYWQPLVIPGLLQTRNYAMNIMSGYEDAIPTPPGILQRRVQVRMIRQDLLTHREPPPQLSAVVDESVLLRSFGGRDVMRAQMNHLAQMMELPNIDVRVLPLRRENPLIADAFVLFDYGAEREGDGRLGDVVCTESLRSELYIEGETDTYRYRQFFKALHAASLPLEQSRDLILRTGEQLWGA
jgi:hypothetical protein